MIGVAKRSFMNNSNKRFAGFGAKKPFVVNGIEFALCTFTLSCLIACDKVNLNPPPQTYSAVIEKTNALISRHVGMQFGDSVISDVKVEDWCNLRLGDPSHWRTHLLREGERGQDIELENPLLCLDRAMLIYEKYEMRLVGVYLYKMIDSPKDNDEVLSRFDYLYEWVKKEFPQWAPCSMTRGGSPVAPEYKAKRIYVHAPVGGAAEPTEAVGIVFRDNYLDRSIFEEHNRKASLPSL